MDNIDEIERAHNAFVDEQLLNELGHLPSSKDLEKSELVINPETKTKAVFYEGRKIKNNESDSKG